MWRRPASIRLRTICKPAWPRGARPSRQSGRTSSRGFDAEYYLLANPDVAAAACRSLATLQGVRLARRTQSERVVRHQGLSRSLCRRRGGQREPARALRAVRLEGGPRSRIFFDTLGYLAANPDVAAAKSIRSTTSCSSASMRAARPWTTGCGTDLANGRPRCAAAHSGAKRCQGVSGRSLPGRPELSDDESGSDAGARRKRIDHEIAQPRVTPRQRNLRKLDRAGEDHEGDEVQGRAIGIAEAGQRSPQARRSPRAPDRAVTPLPAVTRARPATAPQSWRCRPRRTAAEVCVPS